MANDVEGPFAESSNDDDVPATPTRRNNSDLVMSFAAWLLGHRRAVALTLAAIAALVLLAQVGLLYPALTLIPVAWYVLLGGAIALGLVRWIARPDNRTALAEFVRDGWRELAVIAAIALVIGEVARADDLLSTLVLAVLALIIVVPAYTYVYERTAFGAWMHRRSARSFAVIAVLLTLVGPQFRREMPTDMCDPPNYWEQTDYEENESGGGRAIYSCFSPGANDYVAPRVEGRSLFGLRLSNIALRLYSLNFTYGRFEGIGVCIEDDDCFP